MRRLDYNHYDYKYYIYLEKKPVRGNIWGTYPWECLEVPVFSSFPPSTEFLTFSEDVFLPEAQNLDSTSFSKSSISSAIINTTNLFN